MSGVTWHGIRTVAGHEFRLRLRAGRWRWLLGAWFLILLIFTALLRWGLAASQVHVVSPGVGEPAVGVGPDGSGQVGVQGGPVPAETIEQVINRDLGTPLFGGLMLFLLGLALLVVPALTAQSVNGDRERGVLATLQVTLLTPGEIALGKLVAAWGTALVFMAAALPMVAWAMVEGGVGVLRVIVTLLVVALLLGVICALAQSLSALLARSTTSAVLSYLTVFALTVGTLIAFGLGMAASTDEVKHTNRFPVCDRGGEPMPVPPPAGSNARLEFRCMVVDYSRPDAETGKPLTTGEVTGPVRWQEETFTSREPRPERVWWLLAPNPFVILADAAPSVPPIRDRRGDVVDRPLDPLGGIADAVRDARSPSQQNTVSSSFQYCDERGCYDEEGVLIPQGPQEEERPGAPVWPYGLAFDLLLGVGAVALTVRRLRTPVYTLPRGVRIA